MSNTDPIDTRLQHVASLMLRSPFTSVFTGAGISTSSGVDDFENIRKMKAVIRIREDEMDAVQPSLSHMAIERLLQNKLVHYVVTSNHDNLHSKSGVPRTQLAELFGNMYREQCLNCKREFDRKNATPALNRRCTCGGRMVKTGVRFGQAVPQEPLRLATDAAHKSQLTIVLGSSMTVGPFCDLAALAPTVVIVSTSSTPYDKQPNVIKVNAKCDQFMSKLLQQLQILTGNANNNLHDGRNETEPIDAPLSFKYEQQIAIQILNKANSTTVKLDGVDKFEPLTCIESAQLMQVTPNGTQILDSSDSVLSLTQPWFELCANTSTSTTTSLHLEIKYKSSFFSEKSTQGSVQVETIPLNLNTENEFVHTFSRLYQYQH